MFRFGDPGGRIYTSVGASNANLLAYWTSCVTVGTIAVSAGNGRSGGSCLRFGTGTNAAAYVGKTLDAQATWGCAFAFRTGGFASGPYVIASLADGGTVQVDLRVNPDGTLSVTRFGTILATSSFSINLNTYYHLELKVKIDPSAGTVELRINGVARIGPLTGLNTRNTANSSANQVFFGSLTGGGVSWGATNLDYDDIIVWDNQINDVNGFLDISNFIGDCGLVWLLPTGAGTTTQFTPDSGANYARVNEATPDGDTSYVESSTIGQIDTYAMADLPVSATVVKSVASVCYARKTDVGSRGMRTELRSGGGNAAHVEIALGNTYLYNFQNWGMNPNNGSPISWTVAAVNALEAGQTVSS